MRKEPIPKGVVFCGGLSIVKHQGQTPESDVERRAKMERVTVADASRDFQALVHRVSEEGITIDLEQDHEPIVRMTPIRAKRPVMACDLNELFASLPSLGDDAEAFEQDIADARRQLQSAQRPLPSSGMTMIEFGEFLASLPSLGDDSEAFERDIEEMRNFYLPEVDPWQS